MLSLNERIKLMEEKNINKITNSTKKNVYTVELSEGYKAKFKTYLEALMYAYAWSINGEPMNLIIDKIDDNEIQVYFYDELMKENHMIGMYNGKDDWWTGIGMDCIEYETFVRYYEEENGIQFNNSNSFDTWKKEVEGLLPDANIDWNKKEQLIECDDYEWATDSEIFEKKNNSKFIYYRYREYMCEDAQ